MGKRILNEIKYWGQVFLIPIYLISFLFPRDRRIWALGSTFGRRFADNPKYFYLYLNQYQKDNVRPIWISKNREIIRFLSDNSLEGYYLYSLKGIWYSLRAKVYLYDNYSKDICFPLSGGAVKINMWHGIPLKKIQKDNIFDKVRNPKTRLEKWHWALRRMSDEKPSDYVLTTSEFLRPIFSSAFNTDNVIVCGYPRNDILVSGRLTNILLTNELKTLKKIVEPKKKIILYMPTFRDSEIQFFNVIDQISFTDFLKEQNMIFCIKLHPKSKVKNEFNKMAQNFENVIIINAEFDPYPFLNSADILVTDYSSVYFDFLLKDKRIIFFSYDCKEYLEKSRDMYFDYKRFTPGEKVNSQREFESVLLEEDLLYKERNLLKNKVFDNASCFSSEKLFLDIKNICTKL